MPPFALAPGLDRLALAEMYAHTRRLQIGGFLQDDCVRALHSELAASTTWRLAANRGEQIMDFTPEMLAGFQSDDWQKLQRAVALGGRYGFQFLYETIRLPKPGAQPAEPLPPTLAAFAAFMSSPEVIEFMRAVTGDETIAFADAHASRYSPGQFLTTHDDRIDQQGRRAAYVLNLTREWRPDWGGLLLFFDECGNVQRGYVPGFNVLNIFAVPQPHNVSMVTPLAAAPRYAVTGWLRAGLVPE
jgi:Rps23 Pro-64 3,4-dihydroxylase Tpa1-like proline 4-hydroxylase